MEEVQSENSKAEPEPTPKIIGLTGGIGSGKTIVAKFIEEFGFPVYYSDNRAKVIVNENEELKQQIINLLGEDTYEDGLYNKKFVSEKIFNNSELLNRLNGIIHPAVKKDFEDWASQQKKYLVFKETALLFELKLNLQCYKSLLVTAEDNIRIKRVMDRDHKTYREVEAIMRNQMPEKNKIKLANYIIYNNTNLLDLKEKVEKIIFEIE